MCFRPPEAKKLSEPCPKCGTMKNSLEICANCGYEPEVECPKCKTMNPISSEQCANCGYKAPKMPPPPGKSSGFGVGPKMPPSPGGPGGTPPKMPSTPSAPPKAPPAPPKKPTG